MICPCLCPPWAVSVTAFLRLGPHHHASFWIWWDKRSGCRPLWRNPGTPPPYGNTMPQYHVFLLCWLANWPEDNWSRCRHKATPERWVPTNCLCLLVTMTEHVQSWRWAYNMTWDMELYFVGEATLRQWSMIGRLIGSHRGSAAGAPCLHEFKRN